MTMGRRASMTPKERQTLLRWIKLGSRMGRDKLARYAVQLWNKLKGNK